MKPARIQTAGKNAKHAMRSVFEMERYARRAVGRDGSLFAFAGHREAARRGYFRRDGQSNGDGRACDRARRRYCIRDRTSNNRRVTDCSGRTMAARLAAGMTSPAQDVGGY